MGVGQVSKESPNNKSAAEKGKDIFTGLPQTRASCLRVLRSKKRLLLTGFPSCGGTACPALVVEILPTYGVAAVGVARAWAGSSSTTFSLLRRDKAGALAAAASRSCSCNWAVSFSSLLALQKVEHLLTQREESGQLEYLPSLHPMFQTSKQPPEDTK